MLPARENPFAAEHLERLSYRLAGDSWPALLSRFAALDRRAAIVGPEGSGKTTLLDALAPRLAAAGMQVRRVLLRREERRPAPETLRMLDRDLTCDDVILLDGAEQLGWWPWRRFLARVTRAGAGLLIATHAAGRLPTLLACRTSPQLLHELVQELLGGPAEDLRPLSESLFRKHGGNLRGALREYYDRFAAGQGMPPIVPRLPGPPAQNREPPSAQSAGESG